MTKFNIPPSADIYHYTTRGHTREHPLYPTFVKWSAHLYNYGIALITSMSLEDVSKDTTKDQLSNQILDLWKGKGFIISMTPDDAPGSVTGWKMGDIHNSKNGRCIDDEANIEIAYIFHDKENIELFAGVLQGNLALSNIQFLLDRLRMFSSIPLPKHDALNNFHLEYDEFRYGEYCFSVGEDTNEPPSYCVIKKYHDGSTANIFTVMPNEEQS